MKIGDLIISSSGYNYQRGKLARVTSETATQAIAVLLDKYTGEPTDQTIRVIRKTGHQVGDRDVHWSLTGVSLEEYLTDNRQQRQSADEKQEQAERERLRLAERTRTAIVPAYLYYQNDQAALGIHKLTFTDNRGLPVTFLWQTTDREEIDLNTGKPEKIVSLDVAIFAKAGRAMGFGNVYHKGGEEGPDELTVLVRLAMPFLEETK